mgnify:CR=1 FL=1
MHSKTSSYESGLFAEFRARMFLRMRGFKILKSRYTTGKYTNRAEIDIIARRGNLIIFVEVKKRKCVETALEAVTPAQIGRLRASAETFLIQNKWMGDARFDIIAICGCKIHWVKNAI